MSTVLILTARLQASDFLKSQLEQYGYRVFVCEQFDRARELLENVKCDVFVFDLNSLGDAFSSFYQWVGDSPHLVVVPRIFLAGPAEVSVGNVLRQRGDGYVLNKPIQVQSILEILDQVAPLSPSSSSDLALSHAETGSIHSSSLASSHERGQGPSTASNSSAGQPFVASSQPSVSGHSEDSAARLLNSLLGRKIGSVEIHNEIGRGGMGAVFAGYQASLDRKVAVKVMLPGLVGDNTAIERFRREALAIARLKSPYIVQVFDAGMTPDSIFYIVMEYLEGETLTTHLKRHKRYSLPFALHVISQAAQGLHVAHHAGMIHRDIKPSNLMIDADNHITLTDFGLVRRFDAGEEEHQLTQARSLLGTPSYLSPEQATASPVDGRSDIYSLGIVLYQLLVGKRPFVADNMLSLLMKQHNDPLPDPRQIVPELPESVVAMLNVMTAKKPAERFPDCATLLQSITAILSELPGMSQPPGVTPTPFSNSSLSMGVSSPPSVSSTPSPVGASISSSQLSMAGIPEGPILSIDFVKQLQLELAKQIGPIAKVAVKKEAQAMGFSRKRFPVAKAEEWIARLSAQLDDAQQETFRKAATRLLTELKE